MNKNRLVLHPILKHRRSRAVFFLYLFVAVILGVALWFDLENTMREVGISTLYGPPSRNPLLSMMMSGYFRIAMITASAVFAAGLTSQHIVGPVRRIEQWLLDHEAGRSLKPLRVREGDKFSRLVDFINQILSSK